MDLDCFPKSALAVGLSAAASPPAPNTAISNDIISYEWQICDIGFGIVPACMKEMSMDGLRYIPMAGRTLNTRCSVIYMENSMTLIFSGDFSYNI